MISVCIASYNGERYIEEQILSIVPQIGDEDEIIVCDDCSTDGTVEKLRSIRCPQLRIYENKANIGYVANFEQALRKAKGDYIFLCDQDDVWLPQKVATCLKALETADMAVTDATIVDADLNVITASQFAVRHPYPSVIGILYKFGFLGCCICFRRQVLEKALPFPKNHTLCKHDYWMLLMGVTFYKLQIIRTPLLKYRRHGSNVSSGIGRSVLTWKGRIAFRLYLLYALVARWLHQLRLIGR